MNDLPPEQLQALVIEYTKTITIPAHKGKRFLLCPIGLVGSGKTTVVKPLAEKLGLIRISGDEIRKMLKEKGFGYEKTEDIAFAVGANFVNQGYGIALDSDCVRKREQIEKLAEQYKLPVIWIHINPPEEFIRNKLKNFKHTWLFKDGDDAIRNFEARKPFHQNLSFDFAYTFDTSRSDLDRQIEEAYEAVNKLIF